MATKAIMKALREDKPNSAVTDWVDRMCSDRFALDDVEGIPELVDAIELQPATGSQEAARAIRKKLKYGNTHMQIRALIVLKALVENCGPKFRSQFANEMLVERIRIMANDPAVDSTVKKTLMIVLRSWHVQFQKTPGMSGVANLYLEVKGGASNQSYHREQPREQARDKPDKNRQDPDALDRVRAANERAQRNEAIRMKEEQEKARQKALAKKNKNNNARPQQRIPFNFEKEKPQIMTAVGTATQACNALVNALQRVNREQESVEHNTDVQSALTKVKEARKKIVRYTQLIENDPEGEYVGTLLSTNEQILAALSLYDRWCKPPEHDSDEEDDAVLVSALSNQAQGKEADTILLSQETARISLVRRDTELDKLQERQRAEVEKLNRARANNNQPHPDLTDLVFGSSSHAGQSHGLQDPLQPRSPGSDRSSDFNDGLSDYSDYSSEEERASTNPTTASSSSHHPQSSSHYRNYDQYVRDDDSEREEYGKHGLLDEADPFADPFLDQDEEVVTPGIHEKKEW